MADRSPAEVLRGLATAFELADVIIIRPAIGDGQLGTDARSVLIDCLRAMATTLEQLNGRTLAEVVDQANALADRDLVGKALFLVARARGKIPIDIEDIGSFKGPREWPKIEPPAVADDAWLGFAGQRGGENVLENWRREGQAVLAAIAALYQASEPTAAAVAELLAERSALYREWPPDDRAGRRRSREIADRLKAIDTELREQHGFAPRVGIPC